MARNPTPPVLSDHEEAVADLTVRLGERLRARRVALGRTLAELSEATGVSVSHLSTVEKGRSAPSLPVLARITDGLGISLAEALGETRQARVQLSSLDLDRVHRQRVSHPELELDVEAEVAAPRAGGPPPVPHGEDRDVFVYVRSGELIVSVEDEEHALGAGDSLNVVAPGILSWVSGEAGCVCIWASAARIDAG